MYEGVGTNGNDSSSWRVSTPRRCCCKSQLQIKTWLGTKSFLVGRINTLSSNKYTAVCIPSVEDVRPACIDTASFLHELLDSSPAVEKYHICGAKFDAENLAV